jgi:carbon monoxide dehydrogenase subunit G
MKLEQSFTVKAPIEQVWAALVDVERVAPCLPGAEITGQSPDGGYEGTFTVKLGPATASYRGSLKMESLDEAGRVATMTAKGTDKRGQGGANASIVSTMRGEGDETVVEVMTDFTITGRLARFGRGGMIEDISKRLMRDFAQCLQDTLAHEPAAPAPEQAAVASATAGAPAEPLAAESAGAPPEPLAAESAGAPPEPLAAESAGAPPEPLAAEPAAAPAEPALPGEEPAGAPRPDVTAEPPSPAPGIAAEPGPLPGDDAPAGGAPGDAGAAARGPDEADPWGALSPPAEAAVEPAGAEPPPRTGSIPPPSAAPRPAPQQAKQAKPVQGFSLLLSVFWERIKRFVAGLASRRRKK